MAFSSPSLAQVNDAKRASYRAAFEETLRRPGDAEVLLKYAQAAAAAEDYEGAITAYERFLVIDADQPRVKFELGVLYYKLKSYDAARTYFEAARTSTKSTPEIAERSSEFIRDIDRRWGTSRLTGEVVAGIRYSDNPASLPTGTLQSYGATVVPNPTFQRQGDFAFVGAASLSHRYDFGRQDNGTLETDFSFYTAKQFQVTNADVMLLDLGVGPRMELIDGPLSGVQLKPFVSGRYITVGNLPTYWAWGAGLEASVPVAEKVRAGIVVLGQRRDFVDNASVPFNSQNSGNNGTVAGNLRADLTADLEAALGGNYTLYRDDGLPELWRSRLRRFADVAFRRSGGRERSQMDARGQCCDGLRDLRPARSVRSAKYRAHPDRRQSRSAPLRAARRSPDAGGSDDLFPAFRLDQQLQLQFVQQPGGHRLAILRERSDVLAEITRDLPDASLAAGLGHGGISAAGRSHLRGQRRSARHAAGTARADPARRHRRLRQRAGDDGTGGPRASGLPRRFRPHGRCQQ
ncbi:tetratricopeptide repeat protein [Reyranella sp.]|uniref:tetratricopeptide repeat protein n=1 Tax=Reyranella sp. TaxID=1929291 RepID=UPI003F718D03